jgi:hypothetical protein
VVIADAEPYRDWKARELVPQPFVIRAVAAIGEISGNHHQFGQSL